MQLICSKVNPSLSESRGCESVSQSDHISSRIFPQLEKIDSMAFWEVPLQESKLPASACRPQTFQNLRPIRPQWVEPQWNPWQHDFAQFAGMPVSENVALDWWKTVMIGSFFLRTFMWFVCCVTNHCCDYYYSEGWIICNSPKDKTHPRWCKYHSWYSKSSLAMYSF